MNPLIRRRLPPSVRSLLTDICPKEEEEWTDIETETTIRDGILLPSRGFVSGKDEFLCPASIQVEKAVEEDESNTRSAVCMLCKCKPTNYTCPRCNLQYCGLACYQSPKHSVCSEEFYKESVLQELKEMGKTESEFKKTMQEILLGLRHKAEMTHGGMEHCLKEVGIVGEDTDGRGETTEKVQVFKLLSRLAELQQSGEENITQIEAVLRKLEEIGGEPLVGATNVVPESKQGEPDLAEQLSGMNIDKLSEEELWELLSSKEQDKFLDLVKSGALGELVPIWKPWWEEHEGGPLVEVLKEEMSKQESGNTSVMNEQDSNNQVNISPEEGQNLDRVKRQNQKEARKSKRSSSVQKIPPISATIPNLSSLCANPSPLVCYGLINALYGYAFSLCLFNGDPDSLMFELCDMTLALSEALNSNRVFNSVQEALDCGEFLILRGGYFDRDDPLAPARAVEAVAHIMTSRDTKDASGYCLAALSQLRRLLSKAKTNLSKEGEEGTRRQKYFKASKKCEFFQAWVLENTQQIHRLAIELWSDHSRRASVRNSMEKAKTVVEKKMKKEKTKEKLIEELS